MSRHLRFLIACIVMLCVYEGHALQTERLMDDSMADFSKGTLTTSTLTQEGTLRPPYLREKIADIDASIVWDLEKFDDAHWLATGHEGRLLRHDEDGVEEVRDFDESGLYALTAGEKRLYVGASPGGIVYELDKKGEIKREYHTGQRSVWDIVEVGEVLYAATGPEGRIVRIDDEETTSTLVQFPKVKNVMDLEWREEEQALLAATQGRGLLAMVDLDGTFHILIDPEQEEIRRVGVLPDGSILGAVNGERSPGSKLLQDAGQKNGDPKPAPSSFIVRVYTDGFAEEWWSSPQYPIHDFAVASDGRIVVAAGDSGQMFEVTANQETNILGVSDEKFLVRLAPLGGNQFLIGTGNAATLLTLDLDRVGKGEYDSQVFDAKSAADWPSLRFISEDFNEPTMDVQVRYGNTAKPDKTWTQWSEAVSVEDRVELRSSPHRFLQYRLNFNTEGQSVRRVPFVDAVRVFFTRKNEDPKVSNVKIGVPNRKNAPPIPEPSLTGRMGRSPHSAPPELEVSWSSDDPNGDKLVHDLYLKETGDSRWTLLEEEVFGTVATFAANLVPSGLYRIRIVARDALDAPPGSERTGQNESSLFIIDNTQPRLVQSDVTRKSDEEVAVRMTVEDDASLISAIAWRNGFEQWKPLHAADGALDEEREEVEFTLTGEDALPGTFITVLVTDEAGNTLITRLNLD